MIYFLILLIFVLSYKLVETTKAIVHFQTKIETIHALRIRVVKTDDDIKTFVYHPILIGEINNTLHKEYKEVKTLIDLSVAVAVDIGNQLAKENKE